jgi:hypothetical protein
MPAKVESSSCSAHPASGKTAVLDALVADALGRGFGIGRSKADEGDQVAPTAPLLFALRSGKEPLLSNAAFADLTPLRDHPLWLIDRIIGALEDSALKTPVLVVLDDVQWADRLTLSCLRIMPSCLTGSPVVWLMAARDGTAQIDALVEARERDVPRPRIVRLAPLDEEAIEAIAGDRLGTRPSAAVRQLLREAAGNPFLAVSLLDSLGEADLPGDGSETTAPPKERSPPATRAPLGGCASTWCKSARCSDARSRSAMPRRQTERASDFH